MTSTTRREFLVGVGAAAATPLLSPALPSTAAPVAEPVTAAVRAAPRFRVFSTGRVFVLRNRDLEDRMMSVGHRYSSDGESEVSIGVENDEWIRIGQDDLVEWTEVELSPEAAAG